MLSRVSATSYDRGMSEDPSTRLSRTDSPRADGPAAPQPGQVPVGPRRSPAARESELQESADHGEHEPLLGPAEGGLVLRGTSVSPGLVLGPVHRKDYDLEAAVGRDRVPRDAVEAELNRFHGALVGARDQLNGLKARLQGRVAADEARVLDTHQAYLKDSVFISDVENLILNEQMSLEAAIGKVVTDFDRIFRLVQDEMLRERAVDLRDVGIRVLRHLEHEAEPSATSLPAYYVLVARELSIVDMFNADGEQVLGILTEEGGMTSHAAILARSMRIPAITGIDGLLDDVAEGDFVIVDASEGLARINPGELVRSQYQREEPSAPRPVSAGGSIATTRDGVAVHFMASCSNLPAVEDAVERGFDAIGLYRTELLYLVDKQPPGLETLVAHYRAVLDAVQDPSRVTLRLLHAESTHGLSYLHDASEVNPALGEAGVRALFKRESVLRTQLQALAIAAGDKALRIAVPFVVDLAEVRRVREVLFEERRALPRGDAPGEQLEIGVVVETPAAVLLADDFARECEFVTIHLVSLVQHLLATDRENPQLRSLFATPHPAVLRALQALARACAEHGKPLSAFGVSTLPAYLPFLVGLGIVDIAVPPSELEELAEFAAAIDAGRAAADVEAAARMASAFEIRTLLEGHLYGWARAGEESEPDAQEPEPNESAEPRLAAEGSDPGQA